jgi:hypothetical protein
MDQAHDMQKAFMLAAALLTFLQVVVQARRPLSG